MLKRDITYEDFDGNVVTDTYYFNFSKSEMIEFEAEYKGGFEAFLQSVIKAEDNQSLIAIFKKLVLLTYGVKSEDGKRFIKSDELRTEFSQTAAYDKLFIELATNDSLAADFVMGVMPRDMRDEVKAEIVPSLNPPVPPPNPPSFNDQPPLAT